MAKKNGSLKLKIAACKKCKSQLRDDDLNAAIKRKITRKLKHNPILIK